MRIQEEDFQAASDYDILHYLYCHTERSVYSALVYTVLYTRVCSVCYDSSFDF
jgi:hypothetical protein